MHPIARPLTQAIVDSLDGIEQLAKAKASEVVVLEEVVVVALEVEEMVVEEGWEEGLMAAVRSR